MACHILISDLAQAHRAEAGKVVTWTMSSKPAYVPQSVRGPVAMIEGYRLTEAGCKCLRPRGW